jgi:hypothetical protein
VKVVKTGTVSNPIPITNPDNFISPYRAESISCISSPNGTYSATPSFTIINGGGFQSTVDCGRFLRVTGSVKPTTEIAGGLKVDAVYQNTTNYDGITFTNISSTTPSFNPIKAYARFRCQTGVGSNASICGSINVSSVVRGGATGHFCVFFQSNMPNTSYGVVGTVEFNSTVGNARILNTICHNVSNFIAVVRDDGGSANDTFCTATVMVLG